MCHESNGLWQSIIDGASETAAELARQALADGIAPLEAVNGGYVPGMHAVGEPSAKARMFLPDTLASRKAMRAAMAVLDPKLKKLGGERPVAGRVVFGTTKRDIHQIGKSLVGPLLSVHGFSDCCQVGQNLGLTRHEYLVASGSRQLDAQAGREGGISADPGGLAGINRI